MKHDIVYILKSDIAPGELKYSLRSVEQNFPHERVFFFCGCPQGIKPDRYIRFEQIGVSKWEKATSTYRKICETDEVSDDFWLFNDDFFVLEKIEELPYMYGGTLQEHVSDLVSRRGISTYAMMLKATALTLETSGCDTLDYALHVPMLLNKQKVLDTLEAFPNCPMFRSLYGNYNRVGGIKTNDVKIYDRVGLPKNGQTLLSTADTSFSLGKVGNYIRNKFTEASRWETEHVKSL